jgi:ubiquinone/menaquinone biosynthesis C-methylase UbiE
MVFHSNSPRTPRSKFYDGATYGRLVEPLLDGVHGFVAERLPPGRRVLEACCGTGALARRLAKSGRQVVGVDLSPRNIEYARNKSDGFEPEQLRFEVADVSQLQPPADGRYDVATIVLAVHEMPSAARQSVLEALLRVAVRVMVVDFSAPMPWNLAGVRNRAMELLAGLEHFSAFRDFYRHGGLPPLLERMGAEVESQRRIDAGTLHVAVLRASA